MFRIIPEGLAYSEHVLLKNGQGLFFKPAIPDDIPRVTTFMNSLSQESLRMRFMASVSVVSQDIIMNLCNGDFKDSGCLLAIDGETSDSKVVGLANYISMGNGRTAEVAFLTADEYQGRGISTLLLERLAGIAAANGFIEFEAEVLPDNQPMIGVFKSSGFEIHKVWHSDTVHIEFPVSGAAALWKRAALRERISVANSLLPLLRPKVVAVVGASRDTSSLGNMMFRNILSGNFSGTVYPVNPQSTSVNGVRAYSSLSELPEKIDLALIALPAEKVIDVVKKSIAAGAKGIVVVSAGFANSGKEGKKRQKKLVDLVRSRGVRLLGPSCLGVMNTEDEIHLNASLVPSLVQKGKAGFFSHSAALGLVILDYAKSIGVGFTTFVSAGNRADVSGNDFLQYWEEDPNTKMVILYLETFGNPRRFVRIARRMTYKKPILCVKSARSYAGKKEVEAKSGNLSGGDLEVEAMFSQTGIILAPTLEELFDTAVVLEHQPLPEGNKVSIIANSAGMATIFADACEMNGLDIIDGGLVNLGAFTSADNYEVAVKKALINENVDSLLIGFASVGMCCSDEISDAIKRGVIAAVETTNKEKPVLLCLMGIEGTVPLFDEEDDKFAGRKFTAFRFPESAVRTLGRIVRYAEFKKEPPGKIVWYEDVDAERARKTVQQYLTDKSKEVLKDHFGEEKSSDMFVTPSNNQAIEIIKNFGIKILDEKVKSEKPIIIKIKADPLFGPVIELNIPGYRKFVRITPLTDRDLEDTFQNVDLKVKSGLKNLLGRLSQMIEELPWLCCLEIKSVMDKEPIIFNEVNMKLRKGGVKRPTY